MRFIEFTVGLFVIAGVGAIAFMAIKIGGGNYWGGSDYSLKARFTNVSGLNQGSKVVIGGVQVGTVAAIELNPEDYAAVVEMKFDHDLALEDDTIASVRSSGLIGDKYVSLSPGGSGILLSAEDMIVDTEPAVDFEKLISNFAFGSIESKNNQEPDSENE